MSDSITLPKIDSEDYKALRHFGVYMESITKNLYSSPKRMNHLKNVSNDVNTVLSLGETIDSEIHLESTIDMYNIYHNLIKEIYNGTKFSVESLSLWSSDYFFRYKTQTSVKLTYKTLNAFINNTFIKKIEIYIEQLDKDKNLLASLFIP